jgi:uncharacterized membrane protein YhhN
MVFTVQASIQEYVRTLLLCALGCSVLGDIVLSLPSSFSLQAGLLAFMATQFFYSCLFIRNRHFQIRYVFLFFPFLIFILVSLYYLWPSLEGIKILAVPYICLLSIMVFFSFQVKQASFKVGWGAIIFLFSDFILSLDLFVFEHSPIRALVVMGTYYLAQFLIVIGIIQTKSPD